MKLVSLHNKGIDLRHPLHLGQVDGDLLPVATVPKKVKGFRRLDFYRGMEEVPEEWAALREEARTFFEDLYIWEAKLTRHKSTP
jgi:hypothetical protein